MKDNKKKEEENIQIIKEDFVKQYLIFIINLIFIVLKEKNIYSTLNLLL